MKHDEFKYWLQGWLEIRTSNTISQHQIEIIQRHIAMVREFHGALDEFSAKIEMACFICSKHTEMHQPILEIMRTLSNANFEHIVAAPKPILSDQDFNEISDAMEHIYPTSPGYVSGSSLVRC